MAKAKPLEAKVFNRKMPKRRPGQHSKHQPRKAYRGQGR